MGKSQNSTIHYDFELGKRLFERQLSIVKSSKGCIYIAYTQVPHSVVEAREIAQVESEFREADGSAEVALTTVCRLEYHLKGFQGPFIERIGKFDNELSLDLVLTGEQKLEAGNVQAHVFNQFALRLEKLLAFGRKIELSLNREERTVVTPQVIYLMRNYELPSEIAFLMDMQKELGSADSGRAKSYRPPSTFL